MLSFLFLVIAFSPILKFGYCSGQIPIHDLLLQAEEAAEDEIRKDTKKRSIAPQIKLAKVEEVLKRLDRSVDLDDFKKTAQIVSERYGDKYDKRSIEELLRNIKPLNMKKRATCRYPQNIRCPSNDVYRTIDGRCNNKANPLWGSADTPFIRLLAPEYSGKDGKGPRKAKDGTDLPSARAVCAMIHEDHRPGREQQSKTVTAMFMAFSQFVNHGMTKSLDGKVCADCKKNDDCPVIPIPKEQQEIFDGHQCIAFQRSVRVTDLKCTSGQIHQENRRTSLMDGSMVYGENQERLNSIRKKGTPYLASSPLGNKKKSVLPVSSGAVCSNDGKKMCKDVSYIAGDARCNEQLWLLAVHTLFMREHNRVVDKLIEQNPGLKNDHEKLFQEARKIVIAIIQHIYYNEYLPLLLGPGGIPPYSGYKATTDPSVSNVFAAAVNRIGHSGVSTYAFRVDSNWLSYTHKILKLGDTFFNSKSLASEVQGGMDSQLRALCWQGANAYDRFFIQDLTRNLFKKSFGGVANNPFLDLVSTNIMRGREHGIKGYTKWRSLCKLSQVNSFADLEKIFKDKTVIQLYQKLYKNVRDIDLFSAMLNEKPVNGGIVGATVACLLKDQFTRTRDGDRFWHENTALQGQQGFTDNQLKELKKVTLSKVICNNSDNIAIINPRAFKRMKIGTKPNTKCSDIPDIDWTHFKIH